MSWLVLSWLFFLLVLAFHLACLLVLALTARDRRCGGGRDRREPSRGVRPGDTGSLQGLRPGFGFLSDHNADAGANGLVICSLTGLRQTEIREETTKETRQGDDDVG